MDNLITTFQQVFISNAKTGNYIFDLLFSIIIIAIVRKISDNGLFSFLNIFRKKILQKKYKSQYSIEGRITTGTNRWESNISFPVEFSAIMYILNQKKSNINYVKQYSGNSHDDEEKKRDHYEYVINTVDEIKIDDDIFVKQTEYIATSNDIKFTKETYTLSLYSYSLALPELRKRLIQWVDEYIAYKKHNTGNSIYMFSCYGNQNITDGNNNQMPAVKITYMSNKFESNKTFDNIFFEGKDSLIKRIDYFDNNKSEYKRLGIPYTLGFLFYGEPGCGKTSSIKAIANYTGRHIIDVSLNRIKTCSELKQIFANEYIDDLYIPINKRIMIIEDIDCMSNIVSDRNENMQDIDISTVSTKADKYKEHPDKLTLAYILNLLDGILEQPGRMIIISSNYPDKLDKALIRPGRIDMKIQFTKTSSEITNQIVSYYFKSNIYTCFPDNIWTPADVFEKCLNLDNIEHVVSALT